MVCVVPLTGASNSVMVPLAVRTYPWSTPPAFPSGGAGLVSTADDYLAFAEMLLRGGAPILSRPSVETMTSDHLTPAQKAVSGFFPDDFDSSTLVPCSRWVRWRDSTNRA